MPFRDPEVRRLHLNAYMNAYYQRPGVKARIRQRVYAYQQRPEVKERIRQYRERPSVKERRRLCQQKRRQRPEVAAKRRVYSRVYRHRLGVKKHYRLYRQRPDIRLRHKAMKAVRRTKGFVLLCPNPWGCPVDYHHVSPFSPFVVPLPYVVHRAVSGKYHFSFNASMICFLYGLDNHSFLGLSTPAGAG